MDNVKLLFALELLGTVAFSISGAMVGIRAKMDIMGVAVLGLTTAVGGGIIRDVLIGRVPPTAFTDPLYALIALAVAIIVFLPGIRKRIDTDSMLLNIVDAIGLGVFTVVGVRTGAEYGNLFLQIFLGTLTGVGGGILRDVFALEKPMVFVKHFYASPSILGAIACALLLPYDELIAFAVGTALVIVLRILAAALRWHLPKA